MHGLLYRMFSKGPARQPQLFNNFQSNNLNTVWGAIGSPSVLSSIWINSYEKNKKWGLGSLGPLKSRPQIPLKWWFSWFFRCLGWLAYLTHLQHPWPVHVLTNLKRVSANQKIIILPTLRHLTASKLRQVTSYKHFCHFFIFYQKDAFITYRRTSCTWIILCHLAPRLYVRTWKNK